MGAGIIAKCKNCGFNEEILNGYGGIYDYQTFECLDCKRYFIVQSEHVEDEMKNADTEKLNVLDYRSVKCDVCNGNNIRDLSYKKIFRHMPLLKTSPKLKIKCPICNKTLKYEEFFLFDD